MHIIIWQHKLRRLLNAFLSTDEGNSDTMPSGMQQDTAKRYIACLATSPST